MSKHRVTQTREIVAPIGGMNRREPVPFIPEGDAFIINGYRCYSSKLKAVGEELSKVDIGFTPYSMFNWELSSTGEELLIVATLSRIFSIDSSWSATNITGALTINATGMVSTVQNNYLILCNGTNPVIKIDGTAAASLAGFTGPSGADSTLTQCWNHNGRIYFIEKNSTSFWYSDLDAISGPLVERNIGPLLKYRGTLLFGTTWSNNTGANNEVNTVIVTTAGEVLRFSGTFPDSASWQLVGRSKMPEPVAKNSFGHIADDVAVYTKRAGVVLLSELFANTGQPSKLYSITDKIQPVFSLFPPPDSNASNIAVDTLEPFIYFKMGTNYTATFGANTAIGLWCQNLRTGAWSLLPVSPSGVALTSFTFAFDTLVLGYTGGGIKALDKEVLAVNGTIEGPEGLANRSIRTGWLDFGVKERKHIKAVRLISSGLYDIAANNTQVSYILNVNAANDEYLFRIGETGVDTVSQAKTIQVSGTDRPVITEFDNVGIVGSKVQLELRISNTDYNQLDEIYGFAIDYEVGGVL